MKICPECNKNEIENKYLRCRECDIKAKAKAKKLAEQLQNNSFKSINDLIKAIDLNTITLIKKIHEDNNRTIRQLEKNNNNLYNLVKCMGVILEKKFNCAVIWDKKKVNKKGDFVIKELK